MAKLTFKRTEIPDKDDMPVYGELTIGAKTWPTVERARNYTFVRKGSYKLYMTMKTSGRRVKCMAFLDPLGRTDENGKSFSSAISTHLIHDALNDNPGSLEGCIAPGLSKDENGIKDSAKAMEEVFQAIGGWKQDKVHRIEVENNIHGDETGDQWIRRRVSERNAGDK